MKFEDVKIDQILEDKYGNRYIVTEINSHDDFLPVRVECIEFAREVRFGAGYNIINKVGSHAWVLKDYSRLLLVDGPIGDFLKRQFYPNANWDFKDLEFITLSSNDTDKRFLIGNDKAIKQVKVTLWDLRIFDNSSYPTKDNIRLDDIIVDSMGNEYRVIGRNNDGIYVKYDSEFTSADNTVFHTESQMYIPFPDDRYKNKFLTTKEFEKKRYVREA